MCVVIVIGEGRGFCVGVDFFFGGDMFNVEVCGD